MIIGKKRGELNLIFFFWSTLRKVIVLQFFSNNTECGLLSTRTRLKRSWGSLMLAYIIFFQMVKSSISSFTSFCQALRISTPPTFLLRERSNYVCNIFFLKYNIYIYLHPSSSILKNVIFF